MGGRKMLIAEKAMKDGYRSWAGLCEVSMGCHAIGKQSAIKLRMKLYGTYTCREMVKHIERHSTEEQASTYHRQRHQKLTLNNRPRFRCH